MAVCAASNFSGSVTPVKEICQLTHEAGALDEAGIFAWHGNYYAQPATAALGLEPKGAVRIGLLHYNTREEVARLVAAPRHLS